MKDLKQKIKNILDEFGIEYGTNNITELLIEEVIKPIAKEAFEAGGDYTSDYIHAMEWGDDGTKPNFDQWISEKFTSNKH